MMSMFGWDRRRGADRPVVRGPLAWGSSRRIEPNAAGIVGGILGVAGGGSDAVKATTGLIAATSLFVAGGSTIVRARDSTHAVR
jgi:hypothetical protein